MSLTIKFLSFYFLILIIPFNVILAQNKLDHLCDESSPCAEGDLVAFAVDLDNKEGEKLQINWSYGDGKTETNNHTQEIHRYLQQGSYQIQAQIKGNQGLSKNLSTTIQIKNVLPVINRIRYRLINPIKNEYQFTAEVYDPGADDLQYNWFFGDGSTYSATNVNHAIHSYKSLEKRMVRLKVSDDEGETIHETYIYPSISKFEAKLSGAFSGNFSGEVRPMTTVFLAATQDGCDYAFILYDDQRLMEMGFIVEGSQIENIFQSDWQVPKGKGNGWFTKYTSRADYLSVKSSMNVNNFSRAILEGLGAGTAKYLPKNQFTNQQDTIKKQVQDKMKTSLGYDPGGNKEVLQYSEEKGETIYFGNVAYVNGAIRGDKQRNSLNINFKLTFSSEENSEVTAEGTVLLDIAEGKQMGILMANQCGLDEETPFEVYDHLPEPNVTMIDFEQPKIKVRFTDIIQANTVNEHTFKVGIKGANDEIQAIPGEIIVEGDTLVFLPEKPLLDAMRYDVWLKGGENGIKSRKDIGMQVEDYDWSFETFLNFDRFNVKGIQIPFSPAIDVHLSAQLTQVTTGAKLIPNKNTMVAVEVKWWPRKDTPRKSQLYNLHGKVSIEDAVGKVLIKDYNYNFYNQENFTKEDKRKGKHRLEIFGLEADKSWQSPLKVSITFWKPYKDGKDEDWKIHTLIPFQMAKSYKKTLRIQPYYLIPPTNMDKKELSRDLGLTKQVITQAETYIQQIFPFSKVEIDHILPTIKLTRLDYLRYNNSIEADIDKLIASYFAIGDVMKGKTTISFIDNLTSRNRNNFFHNYFYDQLKAQTSKNADLILAFHPKGHGINALGSAMVNLNKANSNPGFIFMTTQTAVDSSTSSIAHELGHCMGLSHLPNVNDDKERSLLKKSNIKKLFEKNPTEGYLIQPNNRNGLVKSSMLGNEEDENIYPLMYPKVVKPTEAFLTNKHYHKLLEKYEDYYAYKPTLDWNYFSTMASMDTEMIAEEKPKTVLIQTLAASDGSGIALFPFQEMNTKSIPRSGLSSAWQINLKNKHGTLLSSYGLSPNNNLHYCQLLSKQTASKNTGVEINYLSVPIILEKEATQLIITHQGKEILTVNKSTNTPTVAFKEKPSLKNEVVKVNWNGTDKDGDNLWYSLYYTNGENEAWKPLVFSTTETELSINLDQLAPGPDPSLKLVVTDGWHHTITTTSLKLFPSLQVDCENCTTQKPISRNKIFELTLNSPLKTKYLTPEYFQLSSNGNPVETVVTQITAKKIQVKARNSFNYQTSIRLTVKKGIEDIFNNILLDNRQWNFTSIQDTFPPIIHYKEPVENRQTGSTKAQIRFTISRDVDKTTINAENILVETNGKLLSGTIKFLGDRASTPQWNGVVPEFPPNTTIKVKLRGIRDVNGNELSPYYWKFQTPSMTRLKWK